MSMGREGSHQSSMLLTLDDIPRSPGHVFYDRVQDILVSSGFDAFVEDLCEAYYASRLGQRSIPPGRYFRMHLVGYFEGIASERGLEWRCSDSLSLRSFLRLETGQSVPDHSWLSRMRCRFPYEVHLEVFNWVLALISEHGLVSGDRLGVDASTMEANAALRNIEQRVSGEAYQEMLRRMAQESGIESPSLQDMISVNRRRKDKKMSNDDWVSRSDPEAGITRMKDGSTHLAYKPEHALDLDSGAVVAVDVHAGHEGDTATLPKTLERAKSNLEKLDKAPTEASPCECVTDKGYHSRAVLKAMEDGPWKSRISEPKRKGLLRWKGDHQAQRAVMNNRARLRSGIAKKSFKRRSELCERSFAHILDRGGMRRTWLRGKENVLKRYLLHVAGHNLSLLMRQLVGAGTPRQAANSSDKAIFMLLICDKHHQTHIILMIATKNTDHLCFISITENQT